MFIDGDHRRSFTTRNLHCGDLRLEMPGLAGTLAPTTSMGMFDVVFQAALPVRAAVFMLGGVLIGFGTRLAGGCTSGHGITGMSQFAPSSLIATGTFMATGAIVTNAIFFLLGG